MEKNQSLNTKSSIRNIKQAGMGKRLIALIMDAIVFLFVWGCLVSWVTTPIANKAFSYEKKLATGTRYEAFSKLYLLQEYTTDNVTKDVEINQFTKIGTDSDINVVPIYNLSDRDIEFYRARIKYYYLNFKTNTNIDYDPDITDESLKHTYYSPIYNEPIDDGKGNKVLPKDYYTEAWFEENYGASKINTLDGIRNAAYDATLDFYNSSYFTKMNNDIKKVQSFIIFPPYVLSFAIFYLVMPLVFKNGETLGKKVLNLGFISNDGYSLKKRQIVFRQILLFAWVSLSAFVIGIGLTSIATLGLGVVIYLIATLISKKKRSPIDYASYLYLIDTQQSVWFKDPSEEQEKEQILEDKMEKYRNKNYIDKHVIQVGDKVVDEDIKKELDEKKEIDK